MEEELLARYQIGRGQRDSLRAYVGNKGEKGATPRASKGANSGVPR